jgi:hypothetical protein
MQKELTGQKTTALKTALAIFAAGQNYLASCSKVHSRLKMG